MKAQIRTKSRIQGVTKPFFTVRMKNTGAEGLVGLEWRCSPVLVKKKHRFFK
jgi:hypothetical protein